MDERFGKKCRKIRDLGRKPLKFFSEKIGIVVRYVNFAPSNPKGGLAQLARALAWHARGHRFDSGNLHQI
jgi:hypothetical protein